MISFPEKFPWYGGDLQTLANRLTKNAADLSAFPGARMRFPMNDGDVLLGTVHERSGEQPLCVLIHGLTGCEDSYNVLNSAHALLTAGYPVLRMNLRGAGPAFATCRSFYHAGKWEDLAESLRQLPDKLTRNGLVLIGFSLGGNMLVRFLSETKTEFPIRLAVTISAPVDLKAGQLRIGEARNRGYELFLLSGMKKWAGQAAGLTEEVRQRVSTVKSVYEFDDVVVASHHGFKSADTYYQICSSQNYLQYIQCDLTMIHAENDPWLPAKSYHMIDWENLSSVTPIITKTGGHCGFHERGKRISWYDSYILKRLAGLEKPGYYEGATNGEFSCA